MKNLMNRYTCTLIVKDAVAGLPPGRTINPGDVLLIDGDAKPKPGDIVATTRGAVIVADGEIADCLGVVVGRQEGWR